MATAADVIRAAKPTATEDECEFILWERTPYPCGKITARSLYKAASGTFRAISNGRRLCDFCDNLARDGGWECVGCHQSLTALSQEGE